MVRESFLNKLRGIIEANPNFSLGDFTISQKKTNTTSHNVIVTVQYNYVEDFHFVIRVPRKKVEIKETLSFSPIYNYNFECEYSPGNIKTTEDIQVIGNSGVMGIFRDWLDILWEELMTIPINRKYDEIKKSVDDISKKLNHLTNEHFNENERSDIEQKLTDLEKRFTEDLKAQKLEQAELESKLQVLDEEMQALKKTLIVFNKKTWFKSLATKVIKWGAQPENQNLISSGADLLTSFVGEKN